MIDLTPFCSTYNTILGDLIKSPFNLGDKVCATNGHIIVIADPSKVIRCSDTHRTAKETNFLSVIPEIPKGTAPWQTPDVPDEIRMEPCADCLGKGAFRNCRCINGCKRCDDDGLVPKKGGEHLCDACAGSGQAAKFIEVLVDGDVYLAEANIIKLKALPGLTLYPSKGGITAIPFKFDGGFGAVMPVRAPTSACGKEPTDG